MEKSMSTKRGFIGEGTGAQKEQRIRSFRSSSWRFLLAEWAVVEGLPSFWELVEGGTQEQINLLLQAVTGVESGALLSSPEWPATLKLIATMRAAPAETETKRRFAVSPETVSRSEDNGWPLASDGNVFGCDSV
nr:hypothetical protein Itr_chr11CG03170 [Ipomoea trifida]